VTVGNDSNDSTDGLCFVNETVGSWILMLYGEFSGESSYDLERRVNNLESVLPRWSVDEGRLSLCR